MGVTTRKQMLWEKDFSRKVATAKREYFNDLAKYNCIDHRPSAGNLYARSELGAN